MPSWEYAFVRPGWPCAGTWNQFEMLWKLRQQLLVCKNLCKFQIFVNCFIWFLCYWFWSHLLQKERRTATEKNAAGEVWESHVMKATTYSSHQHNQRASKQDEMDSFFLTLVWKWIAPGYSLIGNTVNLQQLGTASYCKITVKLNNSDLRSVLSPALWWNDLDTSTWMPLQNRPTDPPYLFPGTNFQFGPVWMSRCSHEL